MNLLKEITTKQARIDWVKEIASELIDEWFPKLKYEDITYNLLSRKTAKTLGRVESVRKLGNVRKFSIAINPNYFDTDIEVAYDRLEETIYHELAHITAGMHNHHNWRFVGVMRKKYPKYSNDNFDAQAHKMVDSFMAKNYKWMWVCCGNVGYVGRKWTRAKCCCKCHNPIALVRNI